MFKNAYGETYKRNSSMWFERYETGRGNVEYNEHNDRSNVVPSTHVAAVKAHLKKVSLHVAISRIKSNSFRQWFLESWLEL